MKLATIIYYYNVYDELILTRSVNIPSGIDCLAETIHSLVPILNCNRIKINNLIFDVSLCSCSLADIKLYLQSNWE